MNLWKLGWKNLVSKPLGTTLSILLLTLGVGMISLLSQVAEQVKDQLDRNLKGIDMVVGAKGSPLQLILASVLHIDNPTGNIPLPELEKLKKNRLVASAIPLSYGDSYQGYRIVGTTEGYWTVYEGRLQEGKVFEESLEVILGAEVAQVLGLTIGDEFLSTHGLQEIGEAHEGKPFTVVGIFENSGSVLDQLIVTGLESIWEVHAHEEEADTGEHEEANREITSILVKFRGPMGVLRMPRMINENTSMQAALPSYEVNRLMSLLGVGVEVIGALAIMLMIVSGISIFISLYNAILERQYEMALMRTYGAGPRQLALLVLVEGLSLVIVSYILGLAVSRVGLFFFSKSLQRSFHYHLEGFSIQPQEWWLLFAVLIIGIMAALIPAVRASRIDISRTLAEG